MGRWFLLTVLLCTILPTIALGVTLNEADVPPDGDFSDDFLNPTQIPAGIDALSGGRNGTEAFDYWVFTDLPTGAQSILFDFAPATPVGPDEFSYNAGGGLRVDFDGFTNAFDGSFVGQAVLGFNDQSDSLEILTPDSFDGELFVSFNFTNGENIAFDIAAPSNTSIIPLPASLVTLGTALFGLALIGQRRRYTRA